MYQHQEKAIAVVLTPLAKPRSHRRIVKYWFVNTGVSTACMSNGLSLTLLCLKSEANSSYTELMYFPKCKQDVALFVYRGTI